MARGWFYFYFLNSFVVAKVKPWFFNCQTAIFHSRSDRRQSRKSLPGGETSTFGRRKIASVKISGDLLLHQRSIKNKLLLQSSLLWCPFPGQALHSKHLFGLLSNSVQQQPTNTTKSQAFWLFELRYPGPKTEFFYCSSSCICRILQSNYFSLSFLGLGVFLLLFFLAKMYFDYFFGFLFYLKCK